MKVLSVKQIREADQYTIRHEPISSEDLMERAAGVFVKGFTKKFSKKSVVIIFCGFGNNGGDGLAVARMLHRIGYEVQAVIVRYSENFSNDFKINEQRLEEIKEIEVKNITTEMSFPDIHSKDVIIDALWGSGLNRPIEGFASKIIEHLNSLDCIRVSIDIPSGLYADTHSESVKFKADYTLSFETPKLSFFFPENHPYVGNWTVKSIGLSGAFIDQAVTDNFYLTKDIAKSTFRKRKKFDHKGTFGHALIMSGSYGKIGATVLCSRACLKAVAGLVTAYIPRCGYEIIQNNLPETMVVADKSEMEITDIPALSAYAAIGIGPGLGTSSATAEAVTKAIKAFQKPMVIDADALNILSQSKERMKHIPKNSLLTPHPKEFERLFGKTANSYKRLELQKELAKQYQVYIILKGAHTAIACPDGSTYFNSTGNPGMATAGIGDALTGILTGLLSQGYSSLESCLLGVYLHGLAGDQAAKKLSEPSLIAGDLINNIDTAYKKIIN